MLITMNKQLLGVLVIASCLTLVAGCRTTPPPQPPENGPAVPDDAPPPEAAPPPAADAPAMPAPPAEHPTPEAAVTEAPVPMPEGPLTGTLVGILVGEGFHDGETFIPMAYLHNRGADVRIIGVEPGIVTAYNSEITAMVQHAVAELSHEDFDALVIPGGQSPDWLRGHEEVVRFAGDFFRAGGLTAAICHGPQVLIEAGVLEGRAATCFPGMREELEEAGAEFEDAPVLMDENLITSRVPDDIPAFSAAIEQALQE